MSLDEQIRQALDRAASECARAAAEERARAVAQATEAATAELRQKAQQQLAVIRETAQKHTEELRRSAEARLASQLAAAAAAHERKLRTALDDARTTARQLEREHAHRLANGIRRLDDALSLGHVLELLAQAARRETDRVAVLVTRGDRLAGWTLTGFGDGAPPARGLDLDLEAAGLAGVAVRTGAPVLRAATQTTPALPPFAAGNDRRDALALPIVVGGVPIAVLYADSVTDDPARSADRWPSVLDVLVRHAAKALEALTIQQVVGLSPPRPMARASHEVVADLRHDRGM